MDKEKFDKVWKVALIIILIAGMFFMFSEFRSINKEAMACKNAPFQWGVEKAQESGIYCYYSCSKDIANKISNISLMP